MSSGTVARPNADEIEGLLWGASQCQQRRCWWWPSHIHTVSGTVGTRHRQRHSYHCHCLRVLPV